MRTGLILALALGACTVSTTAIGGPDDPDMSTPLTPNAKWLIGEFERRYEAEAYLYEEIGRLHARDRYIRDLIIDMFGREQMTLEDRAGFIKGTNDVFETVDNENTKDLKALLEAYSWTDILAVDPKLLSQAFHIVQHSNDQVFQAETLPVFEVLAKDDKIDAQKYALLYDRVSLGLGNPQRYGTQYECRDGSWAPKQPLEDPDNLDSRRAALKMSAMKDYLQQALTLYGECPEK